MNGIASANFFDVDSANGETRNEFNSPQPQLKVCVRIEIGTRLGDSRFTGGLRFKLYCADSRLLDGQFRFRHAGAYGVSEGKRVHGPCWLIGHPAMERGQRE